jgi:hypothetical protein
MRLEAVSVVTKKPTIQKVLSEWEFYTLAADACYYREEYKEASRTFCKTVELLEPWLEKESKQLWKIMHLFVISCHNAAHALGKFGRHKEAEYYYSHAHFRLLSLISIQNMPKSLMESALMELRATFLQLTDYLTGKNKMELAANIKEESLRVVKQNCAGFNGDVFIA